MRLDNQSLAKLLTLADLEIKGLQSARQDFRRIVESGQFTAEGKDFLLAALREQPPDYMCELREKVARAYWDGANPLEEQALNIILTFMDETRALSQLLLLAIATFAKNPEGEFDQQAAMFLRLLAERMQP